MHFTGTLHQTVAEPTKGWWWDNATPTTWSGRHRSGIRNGTQSWMPKLHGKAISSSQLVMFWQSWQEQI
jgi:hypothetical protein